MNVCDSESQGRLGPRLLELERSGFEEWLTRKQDAGEATVGYAGSPSDCPLANYINHAVGGGPLGGFCRVSANGCYELGADESEDETRYRLPAWARRFIIEVDDMAQGDSPAITPAEALQALDQEGDEEGNE